MAKRRKRRKWSDDQKRVICAQTRLPRVSVSQVARRYDVNANQVFNWLKDPRFAPDPEEAEPDLFLPVEVVEPVSAEATCDAAHGEMVVELVGGHRLRITGSYDPDTLAAFIRKLST
ncbi:MAG: transposase [Pseudomonadota bacterium]